jgi:hypothetical protein
VKQATKEVASADFFLLFGPDAVWDQAPPRPASSGATVIGERERLARDLTPPLD